MRFTILSVCFFAHVLSQDCCPHVPSSCEDRLMENLIVPRGFCLEIYANVRGARTLHVEEDSRLGTVVFVGTSQRLDAVHALIDHDSDNVVDNIIVENTSFNGWGIGVAFLDGDLYISELTDILKFPNVMTSLDRGHFPESEVIYDRLSDNIWHSMRYIAFGPDGLLYMSVGSPCNVCRPEENSCDADDCFFGTIMRTNASWSNIKESDWSVYATGVRNSVGFDWHRRSSELWFTDNGRDWWGDDIPPCELNRVTEVGEDFGFPFCGGSISDSTYNRDGSCDNFTNPEVDLEPHTAPLGMKFYVGTQFPSPYNRGIFIAEHGSWNRDPYVGYRVTHAKVGRRSSSLTKQPILEGFLTNNCRGTKVGRPTDVEVLPDGSLIVSDDGAGKVWRLYYDERTLPKDSLGEEMSLDEKREHDC